MDVDAEEEVELQRLDFFVIVNLLVFFFIIT